ncbi:MCE family protein [Aestuariivita boseongensis]|uniref:MCE family protein n=1 Tax=Aestuariivita boseongensis TaxID=1470562 RepID=UPI00068017B5|nr:MlaD family protein [Aestuariivita boseongensis]
METKANYLLIGVFTLATIIGGFGLLLWLTKVEIDRQYAYYDILFPDVAGLSAAGDVRYNGLPVGQVVNLELDEGSNALVRVRIEVGANTPVNTETVAQLQAQGVTGVSYVALSGGSDTSTPLPEGSVIPSERSALQSVFEGAPVVLEKAVSLLEDINEVFNEENRTAISDILQNTADATERLDTALTNFETLSNDLSTAAQEVAAFSNRLEDLADVAETTLNTATETLDTAGDTFERVTAFTDNDLPRIVEDIREVADTANKVIDQFGTDVSTAVASFETFAETGNQTLLDASQTFANANETLTAIDGAMVAAEETLDTAQEAFGSVNEIIDTELDGIITDLRGAVTAFSDTVAGASEDIDRVAEEIREASLSASSFLGTLEDLVLENRRQVSDFLGLGLPEFLRLTEEARLLVSGLDRLVDRVERDPARFLLGTTNSEFRR